MKPILLAGIAAVVFLILIFVYAYIIHLYKIEVIDKEKKP